MNADLMELVRDFAPERTDEDVLEVLNRKSFPFEEHDRQDVATLSKKIGPVNTSAVLRALKSVPAEHPLKDLFESSVGMLEGRGIDLADDMTIDQVNALVTAGLMSQELAAAVLGIGRGSKSMLDQAGLSGITLEEVAVARADEKRRFAQTEALSSLYLDSLPQAREAALLPESCAPLIAVLIDAVAGEGVEAFDAAAGLVTAAVAALREQKYTGV